MNEGKSQGWVLPLGAVIILWLIAFSMICRVDNTALAGPAGNDTTLARMLGSSRVALGDSFFNEADHYFHKGSGHIHKQAFTNSIYQKIILQIKPRLHQHEKGKNIQEIMPWLRFATEMDPHNVNAYLTTAYWASTALERPDLAESILMEAQRNNPDDYRIYDGRVKLAFHQHDAEKAARLLDVGIRLWPGKEDPSDEQIVADLASMLSRRAFLYELNGKVKAAMALYRRASQIEPKNQALAKHLAALERGEDFTEENQRTWESVFGGVNKYASKHTGEHAHGMHVMGPH